MKRNNTTPYSLKGLTLIEIMIALVIGSFLMIGAMGLFMSNKRIYTELETMGRLQENARFAINMLIDDLRMAAYLGCSDDPQQVTNTLTGSGTATNLLNFIHPMTVSVNIEGSDNAGGWLPSVSGDPVGTSDAITIRYLDPIPSFISTGDGIDLSGTMVDGATTTNVPLTCTGADCTSFFTVGEAVAVSDCASTDIFDVTAVTATTLSHGNAALSKGYGPTSQISRFVTNRFYIANGANGGPSLWRRTFAQDKGDFDTDTNTVEFIAHNQELIEGVESMQILYGVDNNADLIADGYVNATGVAGAGDWPNVVSVRIAILVRTENDDPNNEVDNNTYNLLGTVIPAAFDQRRRRVFSTTVEIRNRT